MGLIDFQHISQQIKNELFETVFKIKCFNKSGDTDISRYAETYFKEIINITYKKNGWSFKKAIRINQDTYDLFDDKNKVCIQITSNVRSIKLKNTILKFEEKYLNTFNTLIILFLSDKKPQNPYLNHNFNYVDFNINEFASLIEANCQKSELIEIRDILLSKKNIPLFKPKEKKTDKVANIKLSEREFKRCKNLESILKKELLYPEYWKVLDRDKLAKYPSEKFKDSRFILRAYNDLNYPNCDENSKWCRTFMYDFYERGLLIWLDALHDTKAIINK